MENLNLDPTEYPAIFYPRSVLRILKETPPDPPPPSLIQLPSQPVPPQKVQYPPFNQSPPQRIYYVELGISIPILIGLIAIIANTGIDEIIVALLTLLSIGGITGTLIWSLISYPKRLRNYREREKNHQRYIKNLQKEFKAQENRYQSKLRRYQTERSQIQRDNQQILNEYQSYCNKLKTPTYIQKWRTEQLSLVCFSPYSLGEYVDTEIFDPRGFAEFESHCEFLGLLHHYFNDKIHVLRYMRNRIPDFAYVDTVDNLNNLSIDIEIDEPYTPRQYPNCDGSLKLTHCLGQDNYDYRTKEFQDNDWFVLFFSEKQVLLFPRECCKTVAQLIDDVTGSQLVRDKFQNVQDLTPEPRWTEEEARRMANRRERLNYRRPQSFKSYQQNMSRFLANYATTPTVNTQAQNSSPVDLLNDKKARQLIRKKFRIYLSRNPNMMVNPATARRFLEDLAHPSKTGKTSDWIRAKGISEALKFLENYRPPQADIIDME